MYSKEYAPATAHTKPITAAKNLPAASVCRKTGRVSDRVNRRRVISGAVSTGISDIKHRSSAPRVKRLRSRAEAKAGTKPTASPASTGSRMGASRYQEPIMV